MQINFLEELVAEWYEYNGYIIRRNDKVGRLPRGGYKGELDVIAFHPQNKHLVHIETSTDSYSWSKREERFRKKFEIGTRYIRELFNGLDLPNDIEKIVVLIVGSRNTHSEIGGGKVIFIEHFIVDIIKKLKTISYMSKMVPEKYPLLRTLQILSNHKELVVKTLSE